MPRVRIQFPEKSHFKTSIPVLIEHLNYGNHVGNDKFLSLCHEARVRYFSSLDQNELRFFKTSLIMADAELVYKAQAFYGDILTIELGCIPVSDSSFEIYYRFTNQDQKLVFLAKTGMVYFNYELNKIDRAPDEWLKLL